MSTYPETAPRKPESRASREPLTDAGYRAEETFQTLAARGIDAYISLGREGKQGDVGAHLEASSRMAQKLTTEPGKERYRRRKAIVEPVLGWIKGVLGFRRFSFRGEKKVGHEWALVCLAVDLERFHALQAAS
jgi:hypothetical protein